MIFFKTKKDKAAIRLLEQSRRDFEIPSDHVRARIMFEVESRHLSKEDVRQLTFVPSRWPRYAFSLSVAAILLVATTGFTYAAEISTPGDRLFPLQQLQNHIVLALPLPADRKAQIRTSIAERRLSELEDLQNDPNLSDAKLKATVQASAASLDDAVSNLPATVKPSDPKLQTLLDNLDKISTQNQDRIQSIKQTIKDTKTQEELDQNLQSIAKTRQSLLKAKHDSGSTNGASIQKSNGDSKSKPSDSKNSNSKTQNSKENSGD